MPREPSAAEALYPHLKSQAAVRPEQQRTSSAGGIAQSVWPNLVKAPPPPRNQNREKLLVGLRTLSERLKGGGR
jgi:hypothetical protein